MFRSTALAVLIVVGSAIAVGCDNGADSDRNDGNEGVDDRTLVDGDATDGTATPFDQEMTPEVDSPTNELENQGFETEDLPAPVGNPGQSPSD
jgi:hypothetical protein